MTRKIRDIIRLDVFRNSRMISVVSPERYALSLTFGFYIGLFPMVGVITVFGIIVAFLFRLNIWLVIGMTILMTPFHYLLIYPFVKLGRILFFNDSPVVSHISIRHIFGANTWHTIQYLIESAAGGIVVWGLISLLTGFFVYRLILKYRLQFGKS